MLNDPNVEMGRPPVPRSAVIKRVVWDLEVVREVLGPKGKRGNRDGSDNFPITWAADGNLYTAYGDGYGFEPELPMKLGMGFAKVLDGPEGFKGVNIRSDGENRGHGRSGKKGSGMLSVGGVLYMWVFHADEQGGQAQLAHSVDGAKTWTFAPWKFAEFGLCAFINFGQDYAGARDGYVYTVTHDAPMADGPADRFVLMRVPKDRILDRDAYEFFVRADDQNKPTWSPSIHSRGAVFEHEDACLRSGISYNADLKRYLWWQHIPNEPGHKDRGDTRFQGGFGIYDAPEPWGPWTTAFFTREWDVGPGERGEFPPKWMGDDGKTMYLVFSGDDNFCVRKATLELNG